MKQLFENKYHNPSQRKPKLSTLKLKMKIKTCQPTPKENHVNKYSYQAAYISNQYKSNLHRKSIQSGIMKVHYIVCIALFASSMALASEVKKSYKGYKVYRVEYETEDDYFSLEDLRREFDVFHVSTTNHNLDILIPPERDEFFRTFVQNHNYNFFLLQKDIEG